MVEILLILFAVAAYYVALQWFIDGLNTKNKDEGGKVFGSIIFLVVTGLVVCYFLGFLYPVVVMLGILAFMFIVIGIDFLHEETEVFFKSWVLGVLCWVLGLIAVYPTFALMLREGWFTVSACLASAAMIVLGLISFKRYFKEKKFSYPVLATFACFLFISFFVTNSYPVDHCAVVTVDVILLAIGIFFVYWKSKFVKLLI